MLPQGHPMAGGHFLGNGVGARRLKNGSGRPRIGWRTIYIGGGRLLGLGLRACASGSRRYVRGAAKGPGAGISPFLAAESLCCTNSNNKIIITNHAGDAPTIIIDNCMMCMIKAWATLLASPQT